VILDLTQNQRPPTASTERPPPPASNSSEKLQKSIPGKLLFPEMKVGLSKNFTKASLIQYRRSVATLSLPSLLNICGHRWVKGILNGKYRCTIDLLFDWFGISCMTTDNFCFYFQNRLIQTSQTGGLRYSDTFPFIIPCWDIPQWSPLKDFIK
jgi:hypothetical protein